MTRLLLWDVRAKFGRPHKQSRSPGGDLVRPVRRHMDFLVDIVHLLSMSPLFEGSSGRVTTSFRMRSDHASREMPPDVLQGF